MRSDPLERLPVLLIIDSLAPGGAERSTVAMLPGLIEHGIEPELVTLKAVPRSLSDDLVDEARDGGVTVHQLTPRHRVAAVTGLRRLIARQSPALVHTSLFEADVAGRTAAFLQRVPAVSTLATERYGSAHLAAPHLRRSTVRAAQAVDTVTARTTRRLHAVSNPVADAMARHLRYPRDRIDVVHRGRPADLTEPPPGFRRYAVRASLGVDGSQPLLLILARHEHAKGIDQAIDALPLIRARRPAATLVVAGRNGLHTDELRRRATEARLGDAVRFVGHRDDVGAVIRAADALLLPSRREGLPGSLLEAIAAGVPVVAANLASVRDVVGPNEALIVDATDPTELAAAVGRVLSDPAGADRRARRARHRFLDRFTLDQATRGMAAFYRRAVAPTGPGPAVPDPADDGRPG
ncbi:MAG: glycosyltransferase family 4 protein [Acidimicrobiales bacterium]